MRKKKSHTPRHLRIPPDHRSWRSRLLELLAWVAVAILTAVVLIALSETILPTNY